MVSPRENIMKSPLEDKIFCIQRETAVFLRRMQCPRKKYGITNEKKDNIILVLSYFMLFPFLWNVSKNKVWDLQSENLASTEKMEFSITQLLLLVI